MGLLCTGRLFLRQMGMHLLVVVVVFVVLAVLV
jgi:hypothetical protein